MTHTWTVPPTTTTNIEQRRSSERYPLAVPARLTWKDQRGMTRFASVVTRNISEYGVFVECQTPIPISVLRLVHFQLERDERVSTAVPQALKEGRTLSAVYRVQPATPGRPQGLALRLMIDPRRAAHTEAPEKQRATA